MLRCIMPPSAVVPTKLNPIVHEYGYMLDEKKKRVFGVVDTFDCRERIGSYADLCDYSQIMRVLNPSPAQFEDFEGILDIASDIHDVNDVLNYSEILKFNFNSLPLEVKKHYGNDFELFARDVVGGGFADFVTERYTADKSVEKPADVVVDGFGGVEKSAEQFGRSSDGRSSDGRSSDGRSSDGRSPDGGNVDLVARLRKQLDDALVQSQRIGKDGE